MARSARHRQRLDVSADVAAVLRPHEAARLHDLRDIDLVRCGVCGEPIEPGSGEPTSVSISLNGTSLAVEFSHAECSPSRADLAKLAVLADADPLGIEYLQALHPEAGAVLLWERKLDLRAQGLDGSEDCIYLDVQWWEGFHPALEDEPVRLLAGWRLVAEGEDLVLRHEEQEIERFHDATDRAPDGWFAALHESGFCLLIVGAGIGLGRASASAIQRAIRERRALMGLAEVDL